MTHPAHTVATIIENEIQCKGHKPIKKTKATLVYGPYPEKDGTKDSFCVTFYDPETGEHGEHGEPQWVEGIGSLAHLLEEELDPDS